MTADDGDPSRPDGAPRLGRARGRAVRAGLFAAAFVTLWLASTRWPVRLPTPQATGDAQFPHRDSGHPVLLACATQIYSGERPGEPSTRPADLEWVNLLTQALGGCDRVTTAEVARDPERLLRGRRLLVLPRHTLAGSDTLLLSLLRPQVERGLWVLLERPPQSWVERLGLTVQQEEAAPRLTWPNPPRGRAARVELRLPDPAPLALRSPITRYAPRPGTRGAVRPGLDMDGHTTHWRVGSGDGAWLVLGVDWSDVALSLRQGLPTRDFQMPKPAGRAPGARRTGDLTSTDALRHADAPWLDAWVSALFDAELMDAPFPRAWPAPFASDGFALLAHDDDGGAKRAAWMILERDGPSIPATMFVSSPAKGWTPAAFQALLAGGHELGLQSRLPGATTWRDATAPRERLGLGKLRPFGRLPGVAVQHETLLRQLPTGTELTVHRSRDSLWPDEVDRGFGVLVASGVHADASFGPDPLSAGWCFGSAVPFRPLDRRGLAYPLWETPYLAVDTRGGFDRGRLERWLRINARGGHGPVMVLLRPGAYAERPSRELFELWEQFPEIARRHNHQLTTVGGLVRFWELREELQLHWEFAGRLLRVEVAAPPGAAAEGLAVALPLRWQGLTLTGWEADWVRVQSRRAAEFDRDVRLFSLPDGRGQLLANYR